MTALDDVQTTITNHDVRRVDLLVTDLIGRWQHFSIPASRVDEDLVQNGQGFDGSSLRGFQSIDESDMLLFPDLETAYIDPTESEPTLTIICDVVDPVTRERYTRDPRYVATKAEAYLNASGIADQAFFGPELEFFLFDNVQFGLKVNSSFHLVDSDEADWNSSRDEDGRNLGYKIPPKQGYSPVSPFDTLADLRWEMAEKMGQVGIEFEVHHHEVATGGQGEIATRFNTLRRKADETQWYKHIIRNVAKAHGKTATFMPKPLFGDNGTGMHVHQSLWLGDQPLFFDADNYAQLSDLAKYYIGGLLAHGPSLLAFCAPTTNSYKRLVPGFEAPIYLAYSQRNRSAAIRIPTYENSPKSKRVEFRPPDASANTYLAFSAMLMAGLDGIRNMIDPGDPTDTDIYELSPEEIGNIPAVPTSVEAAVEALGGDHDYLTEGSVFTQDVVDQYIAFKEQEARDVFLHPVPAEFFHYFHI
jgi:glutamine synthetase